jgi:DEAD/DEAH box helicase domain-containing protein
MGSLRDVILDLQRDAGFMDRVNHWETTPPRPAKWAEFPEDVPERIRGILEGRGITRLYSHQREAYEHARAGRHTVIVTPTASGKTLSYNLPVLTTLLEKPEARALYLFPTKALSQDQQAELNEVVLGGEIPVKVSTYDGDTPQSVRVSARDSGRIVISNPDMMHAGILPNHPKWIKFLSNLEFVVVDEIHTYRGVFGSHMTNLVRRIKRICAHYGSTPKFICCSATIGNPLDLAKGIIEEDAVLVDQNGAPAGEKHFVLYNPPLVDPVQGIRRGVVNESQALAMRFLKKRIKTIVFSRSRVRTELIAAYINGNLKNHFTDNDRIRVESYRGGYLPSERRDIERGLRDGDILGVVSTNALELGIDIGGLDVAILAGLPGSIASTWQQAGRAGRTSDVSLAIGIASSSPLDQYLIGHPDYFFGQSPESAWVDPENPYIVSDHVKCAVFEKPFEEGERFGSDVREVLDFLEEGGVVRFTGGSWYWADRGYPAEGVSLRTSTTENVVIVDTTKGAYQVIGEMDRPAAKELLHDQAIYIHRGNQFVVTDLDLENQRAFVEATDVNYYTDTLAKTDIKVLTEDERQVVPGMHVVMGDVLVRTQVAKFKKLKYRTHENVGYGEVNLPEEEMHTRSIVLLFAPGSAAGTAFEGVPEDLKEEIIARLGTLVTRVAPVFLLCDARDIGVAERLKDPHFGEPALYVYDRYPGGTGLAEGFERKLPLILAAALERVRACECDSGCPSCIGPDEGAHSESPKAVTRRFLEEVLEGLR